jgi:hypothetical protein
MTDGWNHRYTYAVTVPLTNASTFDNDEGAITIRDINDNTVINGTAHYVLLSHGEDGKGAYSTGGGQFMACNSTSGKDQDNCTNTIATFRVSQDRSTAPGSDYYDDFAVYGTRVMLDPTEQILYCNGQKKFYIPDDPAADANGCVGFVPNCPAGTNVVGNGSGGLSCKEAGISGLQVQSQGCGGPTCTASCPAGKVATGGACANNNSGEWAIFRSFAGATSYTCTTTSAVGLTASVYCADAQ